jgi:myo-inositol 2-dehydrogenase/D-chiro-inositol 1-dehydrogenase
MIDGELRIAVVGAGRMGRRHLQACAAARGLRAVAAADPRPEVRADLEAGGLRTHADVPRLLDAGGFDAAVIAAPSGLHRGLVAELAAAGLPVLCEKPCGLTSAEVREAAAAAAAHGVLLQVGYWRRFVPELVELREQIAAGRLGRLQLVSCHQWDGQPPAAEFRLHSGGIAIDMGVHELDQLRWLTGQEFGQLTALTAEPDAAPGDPDVAALTVAMDAGTVGVVTLGRCFPHGDSCWIEVIGTAGHVRLPFMWSEAGDAVFRAALAAQLEAFAAAVGDGRERGAGGADAVAALAAAEQAHAALAASAGVGAR